MIGEFRTVITTENGVELRPHGTKLVPVGAYDNDYTEREAIWHWHREIELIHMIKGRLQVSAPSEQMILENGELAFVNSGVMHAASNAGKEECLFHSFVFSPDYLCNGEDGVFWQKYICPLIENSGVQSVRFSQEMMVTQYINTWMKKCWAACEQEPFGYEFIIREELSRTMLEIIEKSNGAGRPADLKYKRANERVKLMLEYIREHYMEEITTKELASCASISESECLRCFKNVLGTTPIQYVKKYRLQLAADMLKTTTYTVTEIAGNCGFEHMSYFAKSFQEMFGITPREYRRRD